MDHSFVSFMVTMKSIWPSGHCIVVGICNKALFTMMSQNSMVKKVGVSSAATVGPINIADHRDCLGCFFPVLHSAAVVLVSYD